VYAPRETLRFAMAGTESVKQRAPAALSSAVAFIVGFVPWIVYWILVGNAPFLAAVIAGLGLAVVVNVGSLVRRQPLMVLEAGTAVVFAIFVIMALTLPDDFLERWLQPLGNAGLFAIVLISILIGKPFTLQYARKSTPREQWDEPGFVYVCRLLAWLWAGTMGFMTIVSAIPPIVDGDATVRDADDTLSVVCHWVLPFVALGLAMLATSKYPDWFIEASGGSEAEAGVVGSPDTLATPVDDAGGPVVHLEPAAVLADETAAVRIAGADPGVSVNLSAETIDAFGHRWRSRAIATADAEGSLELADPNTLVWSMRFDSPKATPDLFIPPAEPAVTLVLAEAAGKRSHGIPVRHASAPGIDVQEIRTSGVVGRLFLPPGNASVPGVVLFPGSEGGLDSQRSNAELLASHGCAALVAATFAGDGPPVAGLPLRLERVPLERFYPDAGHPIRLGCWPTTVTHAGSIALGGTPAGLAAAQADLTPRIISLVSS
jgi:hypothetical protein